MFTKLASSTEKTLLEEAKALCSPWLSMLSFNTCNAEYKGAPIHCGRCNSLISCSGIIRNKSHERICQTGPEPESKTIKGEK